MIKKTIKYTDFNGNPQEEDFYFHLSIPEYTKMIAKFKGMEVDEYAKYIAGTKDVDKMVEFIEIMMLDAYGVKSPDGKTFMKGKEIRESFEYSNAYAELFTEMMTNPEATKAFGYGLAQGIAPKGQTSAVANTPKLHSTATTHDTLNNAL